MNLRKFAHFLAVVENRSFRKACEAVHLSQPALSRSLKSLEDELGIPLLDRAYGRIVPTAYSKPIVDHIRRMTAEARALEESVRRIKGLEEGEIGIGFGPFAAATALPSVMREMVSRYPKLRLRVEIANSGLLLELLSQDRLDLVVGDSRYSADPDEISVIQMSKQEIAMVTRRDHALARRAGRLTLADLKDQTTGAPTLPPDLLRSFKGHGLADFPTLTCDDMRVLAELAENTQLIALVPQLVVDELAGRNTLTVLRVSTPFDRYAYPCIMHTRGRTPGPAATLAIELVSGWFGVPRAKKRTG
ncbi:LysR family transcriptional regulator [Rhodoferax sediminis]|uniref:LysR family transcriptional regulator n=1 Tax=Rhodoferax sediminis TaxID=2509614 RepID=A0A515DGE0_9BURK|nr:LysR family transcriptional regulator [Rhodoferax sediminis]QDL39472.1 LysR family transcriptional regulator [Rhodoferax sediminis]